MIRAITWSYGGGTQSVAIAVLVTQGKLPKPECTLISDTGRESSETWDYTDAHVRPLLRSVGVEIEVVPHSLSTVDLYSANGDLLVPAFTDSGKLDTFCSTEWKKRPIQRYLRQKGYGPSRPVETWIGISLDEIGRAKPSGAEWQEYTWPLIMGLPVAMRRVDCVDVVVAAGLPSPPKSSCWMCPHRQNPQWEHQRVYYPQDHHKACAFDDSVRARDGHGGVYIHKSRVPLRDADLSAPAEPPSPLFGDHGACDSGMCFV